MRYTSLIVLMLLFGSFGYLYYLQHLDGVYFEKPVVWNIDPLKFKTDKDAYHPGDPISIYTDYCRTRDFTALTTWRLLNNTQITFPPRGPNIMTKGCTQKWVFIADIPLYAVVGPHHLEGVTEIQVNPLKKMYINFRSVDFQVE